MRQAVAFLTPFGGARTPTPGATRWFPVVGIILGGALGGLWWALGKAWPSSVAAALVVIADLAVTGMLHVDGLVDSADGLLPHLDRSRRLEVMATPGAGAFGVAAAVAVLITRWAALAALRPSALLLAGLWCLSRTAMAAVLATQPYARPGGLAAAFQGRPPLAWLVVGSGAAVACTVVWKPLAGGLAVVAGVAAAAAVVLLARRRLGGFTGDVLGAAGMLAETAGLVVASARW